MKIEIKHRLTGSILFSTEASSWGLAVEAAVLSNADLRGANLSNANLSNADLRGADLRGADLRGVNLRGATGVLPESTQPLLLLLDQPGSIRLYKLVDTEYRSPIQRTGRLTYRIGNEVAESAADCDPNTDCAAGVNVATLDWCLRNWQDGYHVMIVEFMASDIAAIPTAGDGKIRLHRCTVVGEKDVSSIVAAMRGEVGDE